MGPTSTETRTRHGDEDTVRVSPPLANPAWVRYLKTLLLTHKPPRHPHRPAQPSLPAPAPPPLSATEILRGRNLFILGSTGFVGKVLLSMLLDRFPEVGRVYVMVRRGSGTDSEARFWQSVVTSPAFDPLRARHGGREGLAEFLRTKVRVVDGDITEKNLGLQRRGSRARRQGHRRADQLVGARDVQPAARVGAEDQRRGDQERHRLRQAHEAAGDDPHQHVLRGRRALGRGLGERGAGRLLPAQGRPVRHAVLRRAGAGRQRARRRAHPRAGRRRPGAGSPAPAGPRAPARGEPRPRRRGRAAPGGRARAQGVDPRRAHAPGHRARRPVGLAQHLHVHEEHGRPAGRARDRHLPLDRAAGDRRERGRVSVPRLERGLHHVGAAGLPGAQGPERPAGHRQADPGRGAGRPRRRRHADGRGAGLRRAARAGAPAVQRRSQPAAHEPRGDADRPLQAQALPGQGDRQPLRQRAGGAHGVPPGLAGGVRRVVAAAGEPRRAQGVRPRWRSSARAGAAAASPR